VSGVPILVEGNALRVVVVGGGSVAMRKVKQFRDAGAELRIVAPALSDEMESYVLTQAVHVERRRYRREDIGDAQLVVAATNDRDVNAAIAADAHAAHRLVNVADAPDDGTFATMATHRRGALTIGVSAGGVPSAAARIRDALALRFDARYGDALHELRTLRRTLLARGDAELWRARSAELIDEEFCDMVERGGLPERIASWR
jgi:siroheme synthase-like protein